MSSLRECGYFWKDVLNDDNHPQHRCGDQFMHAGAHVCQVLVRKPDGTREVCGALRN